MNIVSKFFGFVKSKFFKAMSLVFLLFIVLAVAVPALAQNVPCYFTLGGAKFTAAVYRSVICEWEMQSTTVLDIQSGVTETHANDPSFTGNPTFSGSPSYSGAVDFTFVQGIDAGAAGDSVEVSFTSPVDTAGSNTHNALTVDLAIGNATGGTNNVRGLQIDSITGDAEVIETAINVEAGWDVGLAVAPPADFSYVQGIDASATGDALEVAFTSPIDTGGTNIHNALTVDLAIGNATGGTNSVVGLQIDSIVEDAQVVETAINVESGWDVGLAIDSPSDFTYVQGIDAGAAADALEVIFTTPIDTGGSNTHNALTVDLAIGNATGGTNNVRGLQIDSVTGDAEVIETAINIESGWDVGLAVDAPSDFTYVQGIDAGATGDALEVAFTTPIDTAGSNIHNALVVDLAIGNATGGTNSVVGLQIDSIVEDPQVDETAINVESGWDVGLAIDSPSDFTYVQGIDAGATGDTLEVAFTTPIDTGGTNTHNAYTVDLAIGNATAGTNNVRGLQIDSITGDAEVIETAINVEAGWDFGLAVDAPSFFTYVQGIDAGATGNALEVAFTTPIDTGGSNTHNALTVDLTIGNSTAGTNAVNAVQIDDITGDAQVTETGVNIGTGWDAGMTVASPAGFSYVQGIDAGAVGDSVEIAFTTPVDTASANTHNALTIDLTIGNSTAGTNNVVGLQIDTIVDDAQVVETAINIGDEWDIAIDTALPIVGTAVTWMDDFLGDTVRAQYTEVSGSDGQALQTIVEEQFGVYQLTSGDVGSGVAADLEAVYLSLEWQANQGSLIYETRLHLDTDALTVELCAGFTDDVSTVELPFTNSADTVTAVADDAVMFCFDTNATTDEWWVNGATAGTEATGIAATGVAPTGDIYQTLRIEIDDGGADCRFYIDGTLVGTLTANCVTPGDLLAPGVVISSGGNAGSNIVDIDYIYAAAARD